MFYLRNFFLKNCIFFFLNFFFFINQKLDSSVFFFLKKANYICNISFFFKHSTFFRVNTLLDLIIIDLFVKRGRFIIFYNYISYIFNIRFFILARLKNNATFSLNKLFFSSFLLERECYDLFGIFFKNNFDLRRLLTDYGQNFFTFRKDFPVTGFVELRFNDLSKKLVYEPVELLQIAKNMQTFKFF